MQDGKIYCLILSTDSMYSIKINLFYYLDEKNKKLIEKSQDFYELQSFKTSAGDEKGWRNVGNCMTTYKNNVYSITTINTTPTNILLKWNSNKEQFEKVIEIDYDILSDIDATISSDEDTLYIAGNNYDNFSNSIIYKFNELNNTFTKLTTLKGRYSSQLCKINNQLHILTGEPYSAGTYLHIHRYNKDTNSLTEVANFDNFTNNTIQYGHIGQIYCEHDNKIYLSGRTINSNYSITGYNYNNKGATSCYFVDGNRQFIGNNGNTLIELNRDVHEEIVD